LLSAAGFNQANPLRFELGGTTGGFSTAGNQLLQAQWKRLSQGVVDATIKEYELAQALQAQANRQFAYGYWGITAGGDIDPDPWFAQIYRTGGSRNLMSLSDPRLDAMIDRQRTIFDVAQRKAAVREIILYMIDNSPSTIPYNRFYLNAVNPQLRGYVPEFYLKGRQYEWVWLDT
jgi:peptide/nickel transport system substrate-binding protein